MIRFAFYKYRMEPFSAIGALATAEPRQGALIRCLWPDQKVGYSDCFPWPELGDADIDTQLHALSKSRISLLMEQTIWLARKDAILRSMNLNGLQNAGKIKNHFLINDLMSVKESDLTNMKSAGFETVKVKVGRNLDEEVQQVQKLMRLSQFRFRLDFNSKTDFGGFERFMTVLEPGLRRRIEYVEDPFAFDQKAWAEASRLAPLAVDHEYENVDWPKMQQPPFEVVVIKPARQDVDKAVNRCTTFNLKCVVTSSLDHPVGIVHSAIVASEIKKSLPGTLLDCGCLSFKTYKPNEFSNKVTTQGPYISQNPGIGIGFDSLLQSLAWVDL